MKKDTVILKCESSFLSCEKDLQAIIEKLFVTSKPYSDKLKRLLVVGAKDCLENAKYQEAVNGYSVARLKEEGYIRFSPVIKFPEHEEIKSYLIFSFDNFTPNAENPEFRDCIVNIDIICHTDYWDIGDYRIRPITIAGYIDGILNKSRLSGIGTFQFLGCNELVLNENLSGYSLMFSAIHGSDDKIPPTRE